MIPDITQAILMTLTPESLIALVIGALFGTIIGALPGLGTAVAITVCIPFTLKMGNASAIALLNGVYATSIYGGSISAVLINTPGTPQSACTGFEGYAMAKAGKAAEALGWVTMASVFGGLLSCVALMVAAPQLAALSVSYGGPLEICALICMGLACITSLSEGNQLKGLLAGIGGLFLATIGSDPLSGELRFTFGTQDLVAGIDLMPVVVGVFPLAELFYRVYEVHGDCAPTPIDCRRIVFPKLRQWKNYLVTLIRSSLIGIGLGILPGTGATAATFISYSTGKRVSKFKDNYGQGEPDGLVAAESSNNAVAGGAMIPTLALGIPGEPVMALMLATLTLHGITPGVRLMLDNPQVVYSCFFSLTLANLLIIPAAIITVLGFGYIIRFPTAVLLGLIVVCSILGVYLPRGNMFDIWMALAIGVVAFGMRLGDFPVAPLLIGYVLGPQFEYRIGQAAIYKGDMSLPAYLMTSPLAMIFFAVSVFLLLSPLVRPVLGFARSRCR
jgi:putative tricarboxylic transport membrane protein